MTKQTSGVVLSVGMADTISLALRGAAMSAHVVGVSGQAKAYETAQAVIEEYAHTLRHEAASEARNGFLGHSMYKPLAAWLAGLTWQQSRELFVWLSDGYGAEENIRAYIVNEYADKLMRAGLIPDPERRTRDKRKEPMASLANERAKATPMDAECFEALRLFRERHPDVQAWSTKEGERAVHEHEKASMALVAKECGLTIGETRRLVSRGRMLERHAGKPRKLTHSEAMQREHEGN